MELKTKYRVCRVIIDSSFGREEFQLIGIERGTFGSNEDAQNWIKEHDQRYTEFVILEVQFME